MSDRLAAVRRLNRTITERSGALAEHHLTSDRPLAQVRLLFEVGTEGAELRDLRARLGLDSGYLSRLLRGLERDGLVSTRTAAGDQRSRRVGLTDRGRSALAELDAQSDARAVLMLGSLTGAQQERLVTAMETVSTLLLAAATEVDVADPDDPAARYCLRGYREELTRRFGWSDPGAPPTPLREPDGLLLVARCQGRPVGCGGLRWLTDGVAEVKHLWVGERARGTGLGRRLLAELERRARTGGCDTVRLDSHGALVEAIGLYRSVGYLEVPRYNDNPDAQHWFEKRLG